MDHNDKIRIAIVCPPDIYGPGKGLAKTSSALIPMFIAEAKKLEGGSGRVFYYGEGTNTRSWVHIDELTALYLKIVEAAAGGGEGAEWNDKVCFLAGEALAVTTRDHFIPFTDALTVSRSGLLLCQHSRSCPAHSRCSIRLSAQEARPHHERGANAGFSRSTRCYARFFGDSEHLEVPLRLELAQQT
jgi:hypothetical protein